jgi:DASS family divalent anion:Na+ symporter
LLLLKTFPATHTGQVLALLLGGALITPLVPLGLARVAAVAPLTRELTQALGCLPGSRASAGVAFAGLIGYGLFSSIFLSGLVMNFFVLDLLPEPERARFDWLTWLASAAPAGLVLLAGAAALLLGLFRPETALNPTAEVLRRQERALGRLSRREGVTLAAVGILLVGLLIQPVVRIDTAWLAIGALAVALAGGGIEREQFRGAIDWGFLTFFGVLLGTGGVLRSVGVDRWIAESLVPLARTVGDPGTLVLLLSVFVIGCRLVLPWIPATLLLSLALVPAAPQLGLSPWVVGFVVLLAANTWLHPTQSDFYRLMRNAGGEDLATERHGIVVGVAMTVVVLVALTASVPYWRAVGVLAS